jgi:coenzyme F420-reducing hydrogenase delta subunit/NAD-dependent dihydropyrimidine dehydrogenase PreA subunit
MGEGRFGAGLVRSVHRYSSDVAVAATAIHALRLIVERRFTGPRWLAWITGVAGVGLLWFVGWTGYWLVWDLRAHAIAIGTARVLDVLPIFADPMGRSFLTDHSLNSLLFFVVFFAHMLVPLAMAVLLWLHVARLSRPRWIAKGTLAVWSIGALLLLSALRPADLLPRATMTALRSHYAIDAWYLAPLALTDRLPGGTLWWLALAAGLTLAPAPWWMARRRAKPATIYPARCTACEQCVSDCPYDAIAMVPRTAGPQKYALQAEVDAAACVACGICAASCEGFGTDLTGFSSVPEMRRAEGWVRDAMAAGDAPLVLFACTHAAGADLRVDAGSGRCDELPRARVMQVPCAGWVHSTAVERLLRIGARRVAIAACEDGSCHYREGGIALAERIDGARKPHFRRERAARENVHVLRFDRSRRRDLVRAIAALEAGTTPPAPARPSRSLAAAAAAILTAALAWGVYAGSRVAYASPVRAGSELVVTFKHPGQVSERSREVSKEELERTPVHMRRARVYERARAPVRMRVIVDGRTVVDRTYAAKGLWHDGNSVAVETLAVPSGAHLVEVAIGDTHDEHEWSHHMTQRLDFSSDRRRVVSFDRLAGFVVD